MGKGRRGGDFLLPHQTEATSLLLIHSSKSVSTAPSVSSLYKKTKALVKNGTQRKGRKYKRLSSNLKNKKQIINGELKISPTNQFGNKTNIINHHIKTSFCSYLRVFSVLLFLPLGWEALNWASSLEYRPPAGWNWTDVQKMYQNYHKRLLQVYAK